MSSSIRVTKASSNLDELGLTTLHLEKSFHIIQVVLRTSREYTWTFFCSLAFYA